mgnify:CR=1 FL=1
MPEHCAAASASYVSSRSFIRAMRNSSVRNSSRLLLLLLLLLIEVWVLGWQLNGRAGNST